MCTLRAVSSSTPGILLSPTEQEETDERKRDEDRTQNDWQDWDNDWQQDWGDHADWGKKDWDNRDWNTTSPGDHLHHEPRETNDVEEQRQNARLARPKLCHDLVEKGFCHRGESCKYLHDDLFKRVEVEVSPEQDFDNFRTDCDKKLVGTKTYVQPLMLLARAKVVDEEPADHQRDSSGADAGANDTPTSSNTYGWGTRPKSELPVGSRLLRRRRSTSKQPDESISSVGSVTPGAVSISPTSCFSEKAEKMEAAPPVVGKAPPKGAPPPVRGSAPMMISSPDLPRVSSVPVAPGPAKLTNLNPN